MRISQADDFRWLALLAVSILAISTADSESRRVCFAVPPATNSANFPKDVLIIRHGEKTADEGDIHLSKRGQERAEALHQLFEKSKKRPNAFPPPDFIFSAANTKKSLRPEETVAPLALRLKLPIHATFQSGKVDPLKDGKEAVSGALALRDLLFSDAKYRGKTILVSWRHGNAPELARALKAPDVPAKWHDDVFDRVWQLTYDKDGRTTFLDRPQQLLPGDSAR